MLQDKDIPDILKKKEKIETHIFKQASDADTYVADQIVQVIKEKNEKGKPCVLGLATGSTPVGTYDKYHCLKTTYTFIVCPLTKMDLSVCMPDSCAASRRRRASTVFLCLVFLFFLCSKS